MTLNHLREATWTLLDPSPAVCLSSRHLSICLGLIVPDVLHKPTQLRLSGHYQLTPSTPWTDLRWSFIKLLKFADNSWNSCVRLCRWQQTSGEHPPPSNCVYFAVFEPKELTQDHFRSTMSPDLKWRSHRGRELLMTFRLVNTFTLSSCWTFDPTWADLSVEFPVRHLSWSIKLIDYRSRCF